MLTMSVMMLPVFMSFPRSFQRFNVWETVQVATANFSKLGKVELAGNVLEIWEARPASLFFGVGPGTFNSRAFRSIAIVPYLEGTGTSDVAAAVVEPFYSSDLANRYIISWFVRGTQYVSGANTDAPFTSYVSVPVEVGLLGAIPFFGIYALSWISMAGSVRRSRDARERVLASWALTNLLMLAGIAAVDNYLEVTRYTILVWLSIALWQIHMKPYAWTGRSTASVTHSQAVALHQAL